MKLANRIFNMLGFTKLVKISDKQLCNLGDDELELLILDFLEKRNDRFDEAALGEFLNEEVQSPCAIIVQNRLLQLEKSLFERGDSAGLWSPLAREGLERILREIRSIKT